MACDAIEIDDAIFDRYPSFYRGLVVVDGLENRASYKPARRDLKQAIANASGIAEHDERLRCWEQAHRAFGSDPDAYPPSIVSLVRRVNNEPNLPFVNAAVAIFNAVSLRHRLPCGGDDRDLVGTLARVYFASGEETFSPLGGKTDERPEPGEVVYADDAGRVMCRRWNWRNAEHSKIRVESERLIVNIDGLAPATPTEVDTARDELAALFAKHCAARLRVDCLPAKKRRIDLRD